MLLTELTEATEYAVRVTAVDAAENESARIQKLLHLLH